MGTSRTPRVSICQLSLLDTGFHEDVEIAIAVGAGGLGVVESKLHNLSSDPAAALRGAGLRATVCATEVLSILPPPGPEWWFPGSKDIDARIDTIAQGVANLGRLAPDTVFCLTGPTADLSEHEARHIVVEALRHLASVAAGVGTRIAIEPMRPQLRSEWTIVSSLGESLDLLEEVDTDNVGIVFDVWHMWDSEDVHAMIPRAIDRIFGVQVSDYRDPNRGPRDRVPAGRGVAGVVDLLRTLVDAGYDGWYDLELFSDDGRFGYEYPDSLWKLPPLEFVAQQMHAFMECFRQVG